MSSHPSDGASHPPQDPPRGPGGVPDPALLRLAQAVAELNPALARSLCVSGLEAMKDPGEREMWSARLAAFLDDGPRCGGGPMLPA